MDRETFSLQFLIERARPAARKASSTVRKYAWFGAGPGAGGHKRAVRKKQAWLRLDGKGVKDRPSV